MALIPVSINSGVGLYIDSNDVNGLSIVSDGVAKTRVSSTAQKVRNVVTSLQAYGGTGTATLTETSNGAWATQDGVTNVVGDIVFIPATTTNLVGALDAGPWQISNLGSAGTQWVITRPN